MRAGQRKEARRSRGGIVYTLHNGVGVYMAIRKISILGEEYVLYILDRESNPKLATRDGYTDVSVKKIVIADITKERNEDTVIDLQPYINKVIRHEICHAMLYESGLDEEDIFNMNELCVEWIATQFPKLQKIFSECGCAE